MYNSTERIQYIAEYLASYKQKIEALNKIGLFDAAKLYELFAIKISQLWFNKKFHNLNQTKANYPYVDLSSDDGAIYVQVSTTQDIPRKVKSTLEKIANSQDPKTNTIKQLYFFVLGNASMENLKDYSGNERIGNIDFLVNENVITVENILKKAQNCLEFQKQLYNIFTTETKQYEDNSNKLIEATKISRELISQNIDDLINDEYEIDKSLLISRIKQENYKFISIQGEAGVGKSALCKKILKDEEIVLYTRAEKLLDINDINNIWNINISQTLRYLNGKIIIFFVDALEFIADCKQSKLELLQQLYAITSRFDNAFIVTSCRSCDKGAFVKLEANYNINIYNVDILSKPEIDALVSKYPIIREMRNASVYTQLLEIPFYLNIIIKKNISLNNIADINNLRNDIWQNVICLGNKCNSLNITSTDIRDAVNYIVFTRAQEFKNGVVYDSINSNILSILMSEGIVVKNGDVVRLKYDIFEDICFEQFLDREFDNAKGDYNTFFDIIKKIGRCVYRRYQIWVENKLFIKNNREKFLYSLIKNGGIYKEWRRVTIIGIVKSNFCKVFFDEYEDQILTLHLQEFLEIVNLFSFEVQNIKTKIGHSFVKSLPQGEGRKCLIRLLKKNDTYKNNELQNEIVKLCTDYANYKKYDETAISACAILEYNIDAMLKDAESQNCYKREEVVNNILYPIYLMAAYSINWLEIFFEKRIKEYKNRDSYLHYLSQKIIEYALKHTTPALAMTIPNVLCEMAEVYWTHEEKYDEPYRQFANRSMSGCELYGLNINADHYSIHFSEIYDNMFLWMLTTYNPYVALDWSIKFINKAASIYKNKEPMSTVDVIIYNENNAKHYIGSPKFWGTGTLEHQTHNLLGDIAYILKDRVIHFLESNAYTDKEKQSFAGKLKDAIYGQSNNIILFPIIEEIGMRYQKLLPGFAVELASSMDILMWDIQKNALLLSNDVRDSIQKQIMLTMGVPSVEKRYDITNDSIYSIQEYAMQLQVSGNETLKNKIYNILDYLYKEYPNDEEHAVENLQIQKMDMRNTYSRQVTENMVELTPVLKGKAKEIVEKSKDNIFNVVTTKINLVTAKYSKQAEHNNLNVTIEECVKDIDELIKLNHTSEGCYALSRYYVMLIVFALANKELDRQERTRLCMIWIEGIRSIFENKSFSYEIGTSFVLFKQVEENTEKTVQLSLKRLILDLLLYQGMNGIINEIANVLKKYLKSNEKLAKSLCNTIIKLAVDQMQHNMFNADYVSQKDKYVYVPNRTKISWGIDEVIKNSNGKPFQSKKEKILDEYLFREENLNIESFDIQQYDISTLCYIADCGLSLENEEFKRIIQQIIAEMIEIWYSCRNDTHNILDIQSAYVVLHFFGNSFVELKNVEPLLDVLFLNTNFLKFTENTIQFYEKITHECIAAFFDAYNEPTLRRRYIEKFNKLEKLIINISDEKIKIELSKMLFLSAEGFYNQDWNKFITSYSYSDKMFLNDIWSKYGVYHPIEMFNMIYQLHIKDLLPEVLIPINKSLKKLKENSTGMRNTLININPILNIIITEAFLNFNDKIKQEKELVIAYEEILEILIDKGSEDAAVILDEFRIH